MSVQATRSPRGLSCLGAFSHRPVSIISDNDEEGKTVKNQSIKMSSSGQKMSSNPQENICQDKIKSYADVVLRQKKMVWNKRQKDIIMEAFMDIIRNKYGIIIDSYWDLHKWSVQNIGKFWEEAFKYFEIIYSEPYCEVLPPYEEIIGIEWFRGLKFNYAENILRYRDGHVALICLDEEGREKTITYAEVYEEVKRYATALRKHGLKTGDKVACYMPNREEPLFAMLACVSIGAIWGGIVPFYGPKAAARVLQTMNPKFLFTVDRFIENKTEYNILSNLASILIGITSIEKVIILATEEKTLQTDISGIRGSCFLDDFLETGSPHHCSNIADLQFEHLPFNHPVSINFTSGTTGIPKGMIHAARVILPILRDFALHWNCTRDDVMLNMHPCGWTIWNAFVSSLAVGCTLVLYCGNPFFSSRTSVWDMMSKYKITATAIVTSVVDKMEKFNIVPDPSCDLSNLRLMAVGGSPVKHNNFHFLNRKVKQDMLVEALYGSTEVLPFICGFHLNSPVYSGQLQNVALGVDLKIFEPSGNPVIGQQGEVVICSPLPSLPVCLLNDENEEKMRASYLSKFPGVWALSDEGLIDPETNGVIILGRSDEILNPQEERFVPSDIYSAIKDIDEIVDSLCVRQNSSKGYHRAVLFVKLTPNCRFTKGLVQKISKKIEEELTEYHIPEVILETKEIPFNANGKKMGVLVSKILDTNIIPECNNSRNPQCLESYRNIPELQDY